MKILFINQWFQPEAVLRGLPLARALVDRGHEVEVLTGFPNYPHGKIYEGYTLKLWQRDQIDDIPISRVFLYPSHDRSVSRRFLNFSSFALSASMIGPWMVRRPDVVYVYHPPATAALPGVVFKYLRGVPMVYDIQDLWPDTFAATGMFNHPLGLRLIDGWCRWVYRVADRIVVLSPGFKRLLIERGVPEAKIEVVYNWADDTVIAPVPRDERMAKELGLEGRFNIMFAGNMGSAQALHAVVDAAAIVQRNAPKIQFVFVGDGVETQHLMEQARAINLNNVCFLERRPISEIAAVMALADVLLVHLRDDPLFRITVPSKIQTYLAMGKPILLGVRGDAESLLSQARAGLSCTPESHESIARKAMMLYNMPLEELAEMGKRGERWYRKTLSLASGAQRMEAVFESAIRSYRGGAEA